jgi:hypothetical protein
MKLIEAISTIRAAIDRSSEAKEDGAWARAVEDAGLKSQGNKGALHIDEDYLGDFGPLQLRVNWTCRDTSRTFSPGPDRTRLTLQVLHQGAVLDSYVNGYED